jgi:hypothetical protein
MTTPSGLAGVADPPVMNVADERPCPECAGHMTLEHQGRFSTLYICRTCGSRMTIPSSMPAGAHVSDRSDPRTETPRVRRPRRS